MLGTHLPFNFDQLSFFHSILILAESLSVHLAIKEVIAGHNAIHPVSRKIIFTFHRFLHPEDEGWPGLEPLGKHLIKPDADTPRRRYSDSVRESALPPKPESSPPRRSERRSLVSQHDLFTRQKLEGDDRIRGSRNHVNFEPMRGRQRDRKRSAERDHMDFNTNPIRLYDRRPSLKNTPNRSTADCPAKSNSQKTHSVRSIFVLVRCNDDVVQLGFRYFW